MDKVTPKRLKELERAEAKLEALEAGGVNNWDGYDDSLEAWRKENAIEERRAELLDDIMTELGGGAYEPSERGGGVAFYDETIEKAARVLETYKVTFEDL